jgi:tetratricopeptide (TPR) repeat protein
MKQWLLISAILLVWGLSPGPLPADDSPAPLALPRSPSLDAGRKAVDAKDFKSALGHLTQAAKEAPNDADVQNLLGYSYRKLGQLDGAMEHYRLALKIDPKHRGAQEYMGELYLEMDQLANAEQLLKSLSKACPWFGRCEEYDDLKGAIEKYKAKKR